MCTAGNGKPVTITKDYYGYPGNTSVVLYKKEYTTIENITKTMCVKGNVDFMAKGKTYQCEED